MIRALLALSSLLAAPAFVSAAEPAKGQPPESRKPSIPSAASEGERQLRRIGEVMAPLVKNQGYGKRWRELVHTDAAPESREELSKAETHEGLEHDRIEMQSQVQFLEEMRDEARYGFVSVRGVRVYRYGKLVGVQLLFDRIGRRAADKPAFDADLEAVMRALSDPKEKLGLDGFSVVRNDLVAPKRVDGALALPLRVELEPKGKEGK